ncbi:MAG: DNA-directed RNA polymerase subunit alpha [Sphingobacteriales bacterium]|jgi:DNA-directed RNA polymerase subunit alpha|nr:DNA-directed RNA polymerase subunit alpha [Sphingobacteriales bacterium]MCC7222610.1 DNA-directed RNA polymerase subunit alpha [Chitinophagales bacterium]
MAVLSFQKPEKILAHKTTDFEGTFEFRPLEPGFGVTVGNAIRRVLLSSLEGYAITAIKIGGVEHEFSTVKGVLEDVTEIILNLKQVRFRKVVKDDELVSEKIYVSIRNAECFYAGDIEKHTSSFKITNPNLVICNMESSVNLDIELTIQKGRGYVPADENKPKEYGIIPVDAIYTPIKNVRYTIENTRVEQKTDYEKLVVEIKTDGTIHPEDAIKEAARILIQHLMLISDENITFDSRMTEEDDVVDEHILHMRKLLKTPLEDLDLSVRAYNCLKAAKINNLSELVQYDTNALIKFRNFGKKSLMEIEELIVEKGLHFGMDLSKYKLEED